MNKTKFRDIIKNISTLNLNSSAEIETCWEAEVSVLAEDISGTIDFLTNECTEDEYAWISKIIDDLIEVTQSWELLNCYKQLIAKFPNACATYNIAYTIECAESALSTDSASG